MNNSNNSTTTTFDPHPANNKEISTILTVFCCCLLLKGKYWDCLLTADCCCSHSYGWMNKIGLSAWVQLFVWRLDAFKLWLSVTNEKWEEPLEPAPWPQSVSSVDDVNERWVETNLGSMPISASDSTEHYNGHQQ